MVKDRRQELLDALFNGRCYTLFSDNIWAGTIFERMFADSWEADALVEFGSENTVSIHIKYIYETEMISMAEIQVYLILMLRQHFCPTMDVTLDTVIYPNQNSSDEDKNEYVFQFEPL